MKAVLLAAGRGTRLLPITNTITKQMIKIAGKPLLEHIIDDLVDNGYDEICIVIGHYGNQIKKYFECGKKFNAKISYVNQKEYKGTADATYYAKRFVGKDSFLLYLSDTLIPNLSIYLKKFSKSGESVQLLSSKVKSSEIKNVGNIQINKKNFVIKIIEKPTTKTSNLAWAGVALFRTNLIFQKIHSLKLPMKEEYDITDAINDLILCKIPVKNYCCEEFLDSGTPRGFHKLMKFILTNKLTTQNRDFLKFKNIKIKKAVYVGKNCSFGYNTTLGPYVSIDDNVNIADNVKISESVILDGTEIKLDSHISKSLIFGTEVLFF